MRTKFILIAGLICTLCFGDSSFAQEKVRIGYIGLSLSSLPLAGRAGVGIFLAKRRPGGRLCCSPRSSQRWRSILGSCSMSPAWAGFGERDPGGESVARGVDRRQPDDLRRYRAARVENASRPAWQTDRGERTGRDNPYRFTMAIEKTGANPKDFVVVRWGHSNISVRWSLKSVDAMIVDPPVSFRVTQKRFQQSPRHRRRRGDAGGRTDHVDEDARWQT